MRVPEDASAQKTQPRTRKSLASKPAGGRTRAGTWPRSPAPAGEDPAPSGLQLASI